MAKKKLFRCIAETSVKCRDIEFSRRFGVGQVVDVNEAIAKDARGKTIKLGDRLHMPYFEEAEATELHDLEADHQAKNVSLEEETEGE